MEQILEEAFHSALQVRNNAYAPYSHYQVGASVVTGSGNIYAGCNVENASYGATICAERNAVLQAVAAEGSGDFRLLVVVTDSQPPAPPCALCLQVLAEFCEPDLPVYLMDLQGHSVCYTFKELLQS